MKARLSNWIGGMTLLLSLSSQAQHHFSGSVKDTSGTTVPGIGITIDQSYKGTYTNAEGDFNLKNLADGTYPITISSIGYEIQFDTITIKGQDLTKTYIITPKTYVTDEVVIKSSRAGVNAPTTYSDLSKSEIEEQNFGQDLPFLLDITPSTVVTSDAGAGVGYTGIRIRGVDPTRTNVTINGIPVNDPESHGVWWVNMPDFASSVSSLQVQRGVGTSTNGSGAFGASINMQTNEFHEKPYAEIANSYGSFNTFKNTIMAGTGLLNKRFSVDARLSQIQSDGYIDRASADLKSYYLAGAYYGDKTTIKANLFSGKEITYQSWYGTPEAVFKQDQQGIEDYIARNWLEGTPDATNLRNAGRTYNFYTYDNEVDNYGQDHYQLHLVHQFNKKLSANISGHYTYGRGFYEQYRTDDDLADYNLDPVLVGTDTITSTDLIRRRWLDNHFYGVVYALNYKSLKGFDLTYGGAANTYEGTHFGEIIWARFASDSEIRDRYYDNYANKAEVNNYLKMNYEKKDFLFYLDLQHRYIHYQFQGQTAQNNEIFPVTRKVHYNFFNPKAGVSYRINDQNKLYLSYSVANREPVRNDFVQSSAQSTPVPEQLQNLEVGHQWKSQKTFLKSNFYLMNYRNQLVLTGEINDVGAYNRTNIDRSYRYGLELEGGFKAHKTLTIGGNMTWSENKIVEFTEYIDDYDNGGQLEIQHQNTDIAFSPNLIAGGMITWTPGKYFEFALLPKYVGRQFLDNTGDKARSIDPYTVTNFRAQFTIKDKLFRELQIGLLVNNLFDVDYASNGYTFSYIAGGSVTENFYYPQAGTNFLANLVVKF